MIANTLNKPNGAPTFRTGDERLVKLTASAALKVSTLLTKQGRPKGVLRVAVVGGGCSGLQYKMDLQDGPVTGSELDYIEALDGGFKVKNPNAATSCSCGESFSA
ncbi:MAG: iron-sulfur cluster assembly accessory protein [Acidobacteria bacterium]|nr:MAG: iron-sulfur cluster assembly accessory protein [Acidobacteriota bacterium]